jgi:glycerophosphoryl diester phosphodiesterase
METNKMLVIAHRGARGEAPENTLAAFRLGLEQGCTAIELDIHMSKDGELIVCHDATLNRTTDSSGTIHEMTVAELKRADAGRWFHEKYAGERLPLLEEVFDLTPSEVMINVEIKGSYGRKLEPALLQLMERKNRVENVVVSSFDHKSLMFLKLLEPEVRIGLLYDANISRHSALADTLGVPVYSLHPQYKRIDKEDVRDALARGLQVYPWTINDEAHLREAVACGVSGIITDYPGRLNGILSELGSTK